MIFLTVHLKGISFKSVNNLAPAKFYIQEKTQKIPSNHSSILNQRTIKDRHPHMCSISLRNSFLAAPNVILPLFKSWDIFFQFSSVLSVYLAYKLFLYGDAVKNRSLDALGWRGFPGCWMLASKKKMNKFPVICLFMNSVKK